MEASRPFVVGVACWLGLSAAAAEMIFAASASPAAWRSPGIAAAVFSATAAAVALAHLAGWFLAVGPLASRGRKTEAALAGWTLFVAGGYALLAIQDFAASPQSFLAAAGLGYIGFRRASANTLEAFRVLAPAPFFLGAIAAWRWSLVAGASIVALVVICMLLLAAARLATRGRPTATLSGFLLALTAFGGITAALYQPGVAFGAGGSKAHRVPRVLLLVVDTLRADVLSTYNPEAQPTTNIDALAADSVVFERAYSAAPWTLPAMTSMFSGLPVAAHRVNDVAPPGEPEHPVTASELSSAGYHTGAIVSNPFLGPEYGFAKGFAEYRWFPQPALGMGLGAELLRAAMPGKFVEEVGTEGLTNLGLDWIDRNQHHDFFLWLQYFDPHVPYGPPTRLLPSEGRVDWIGDEFDYHKEVRAGMVLNAEDRRWIEQLYLAEVQLIDENVGRLIDSLKADGLYDETLIILTSDHGEEFWEHGAFEHGHSVYDEVVRVPLVVKLPRSAQTGRVRQAVSTAWVSRTILDLTETIPSGECAPAHSLRTAWEGGVISDTIVSEGTAFFEDKTAVMFDDHEWIREYGSDREQLFRVSDDPGELRLLGDEELVVEARAAYRVHRESAAKMRACLGAAGGLSRSLDEETRGRLESLGYIN